jgi:hypothetical protein
MRTFRAKWASTLIAVFGCGEAKVDPTIAQAVKTESKMEKAAEELAERDEAEREAAARAKQELEQRRKEEIDAAAIIPADTATGGGAELALGDACDAVVIAYDEFMKRGSEQDVLQWHDGRRRKLGERRTRCIEQGDPQVAACEAHALSQTFPSLEDVERTKAALMVMQRCADKFGE